MILALLLAVVSGGLYPTGVDKAYQKYATWEVYDSDSASAIVPITATYINGVVVTPTVSSHSYTTILPTYTNFVLKQVATGYNDLEQTLTYATLNAQKLNMVKVQGLNACSGVINWDHSTSVDFDSYMYIYDSSGSELSHVYYGKTSWTDSGSTTTVTTTKDDLGQGSGETTTIDPINSTYTYKFYLYQQGSAATMMAQKATCNVTIRNVSKPTVNIPEDGVGKWWHVYDIVNGEYQVVNTVSSSR